MIRILRKAAGALDEVLYGRELARIRWHQARIDEIAATAAAREDEHTGDDAPRPRGGERGIGHERPLGSDTP